GCAHILSAGVSCATGLSEGNVRRRGPGPRSPYENHWIDFRADPCRGDFSILVLASAFERVALGTHGAAAGSCPEYAALGSQLCALRIGHRPSRRGSAPCIQGE